jgi:signal transduction histidine kinase
MHQPPIQRWQINEILISLFVLFILFSYTYALLFLAPSPGFAFNNTNGRIVEVYTQPQEGMPTLQIGDVIKKIGPVSWETYQTDDKVLLFEGFQVGDIVEIIVDREGKTILIPWKFTGLTQNVLSTRLVNIWGLSFLFFFVGAAALALIRPRDILRNLFVAINYLTALWLIFGMLSHSHIWLSSGLLHASTWLLLPVYLHFHWLFPKPLKPLSKTFIVVFYLICLCFAIAEFFQLVYKSLYALAFLIALAGSFTLQVIHYKKHEDQRRDIKLLAIALAIAFLPPIVLGILIATGSAPHIAVIGLFSLPFMPLAYFYAIYRRSMGGLEIRLNRIISLYLFLILFGVALFITVIPLVSLNLQVENVLIISIVIILALVYTAISIYPKFQTFVEKRYLGIKLDSQTLQEEYISRIIASTSLNNLLHVLENEVFPSLLIRQYAFVQNTNGNLKALLTKNVSASEMPDETATNSLLERSGKFIPDFLSDNWMRLILPLQVDDSLLGFFLLGQRDPDDLYHQTEIPILQAIANQTAIAFSNSLQAEQLKQMYELGIERYEEERKRLARDLHDSVLNELSDLRRNLGEHISADIQNSYEEVIQRLREIVNDIRSPMLMYGLAPAIKALAEELMQKTDNKLKVIVDLQTSEDRMPEKIEVHLFRVVQEACQNSLKHAQASSIKISGSIAPEKTHLLIEDDGIGFDIGETSDLGNILASRHFGLLGIVERAHVIGAKLKIEPKPHTKIQIWWEVEKRDFI